MKVQTPKQNKKHRTPKEKHWIRIDNLPSKFLAYPKSSKVYRRNFSLGELKHFQKIRKDSDEMLRLMKNAIRTDGMVVDELTVHDFEYISFLLVFASVPGGQISYNYVCPKCGYTNTEVLTRDKGVIYTDLEIPSLPIILPLEAGYTLHFDVPKLKHQEIIIPEDIEDPDLYKLASLVTNMPIEDAYTILYHDVESPTDFEMLTELEDLMYHGLKEITRECRGKVPSKKSEKKVPCKNKITFKVETEAFYIPPFRKSVSNTRSKIRFGNDATPKPE